MFYFRKLLKQHQDISHQESLRSTKASTNSGVVQIPRGELRENGGKNRAECNELQLEFRIYGAQLFGRKYWVYNLF